MKIGIPRVVHEYIPNMMTLSAVDCLISADRSNQPATAGREATTKQTNPRGWNVHAVRHKYNYLSSCQNRGKPCTERAFQYEAERSKRRAAERASRVVVPRKEHTSVYRLPTPGDESQTAKTIASVFSTCTSNSMNRVIVVYKDGGERPVCARRECLR